MIKTWKASLLVLLAFGLCISAIPISHAEGSAASPAKASKSEPNAEKKEDEIRSVLAAFTNALSTADAAKVASLWTEDANFIDQSGEQTQGRGALLERFSKRFKEAAAAPIGIHPENISLPADNVALVLGTVSRKQGELDLPATRFSMMLVKQEAGWLIKEATETTIQAIKSSDQLKELQWLIGTWQVDQSQGSTKLELEWTENRNFIQSKCVSDRGGVQHVDKQIIGFDPRSKSIVSWHFDANGGFGYSKWTKQSDRWLVEFAGVAADGAATRATNVFTMKSPEEFTWQSTKQSADGMPIPDTEALSVKKIKS